MKCLGFFLLLLNITADMISMTCIVSYLFFFAFLRCMVTIFMMIGVMNLDAA